jgi:hypothetical protein
VILFYKTGLRIEETYNDRYLISNITVNEIAKEVLYQTIKESGVPSGKGLRLEEFQGGFSLNTDTHMEADRVIKHNKSFLIIIEGPREEY